MAILASIEVQDDGSLKIKNFRDALSELEGQGRKSGNAFDALSSGTDKATSGLDSLKSQATSTAIAFGALAAGIGSLLVASGNLAGRIEVLYTVLGIVGKNANISNIDLLKQVEAIKALGITTSTAVSSVIQFANANLKVADAAKLARVAQDLAVVAGLNSSQAYQMLSTSIQTQETLLLRNFGIVTSLDEIYRTYAATLGKTWKELDANEKKQAFLSKIMSEGAKVTGAYEAAMNDASKQIGSFSRFIETAQEKIGAALTPAMLYGVEAATRLVKSFIDLDVGTQRLITSFGVFLAVMAAVSAAVATSRLLALPAIIASLASPLGIVIGLLAAAAAAFVYFSSQESIATEEAIQSVAKTESQIERLGELQQQLVSVGTRTNETKGEQLEYNNVIKSLIALAPNAATGVDEITGAYRINIGVLKETEEQLKKVLEAKLSIARDEFAKRANELNEAQVAVNNAYTEQQRVVAKSTELQTKLNANYGDFVKAAGSAAGAQERMNLWMRESKKEVDAAKAAHIELQKEFDKKLSAYTKELELMNQLDPARRKEINDAKELADRKRDEAAAAARAAAAAQKEAEEKAKAYAKALAAAQGLSKEEVVQYQAVNDALMRLKKGTEEYYDTIVRNKSIIEKAATANDSLTKGLDALKAAAEEVKKADLAVELKKWGEKAQELKEDISSATKEITKSFTQDLVKAATDSSERMRDAYEKAGESIVKVEQEVNDRVVTVKMNAVERQIYENNKYYANLIENNNKQILELERMMAKEDEAIVRMAQARQREIDDIIAKAQIKFKVETDTDSAIQKFRQALQEDRLADAQKIQTDFIASLNAMGAAEKTRIERAMNDARTETDKKGELIRQQVAEFERQNARLREINKGTNGEIIQSGNKVVASAKEAWASIRDSFSFTCPILLRLFVSFFFRG